MAGTLDTENKALLLLHGCAAGPVLLEFVSKLVPPLQASKVTRIEELAAKTGFKAAPLALTLRTCSVLGYVDVDFMKGECSLLQSTELDDLCRCLGQAPDAAAVLRTYADTSVPFEVPSAKFDQCLATWSRQRESWGKAQSKILSTLLEGILLGPILASIACLGRLQQEEDEFDSIDVSSMTLEALSRLESVMAEFDLGSVKDKIAMLSSIGRGVMQKLLRWVADTSFDSLHRLSDLGQDIAITSTSQRGLFHRQEPSLQEDLLLHIESFFSGEDYKVQPRFVVDTGCGDGSLLIRIFELVKATPRGKVLTEFPLTMVGIAPDEEALVLPKMKLCERHIPHKVFTGDISNPRAIVSSMKTKKIDPGKTLHVRLCQDQCRGYVQPELQLDESSPTSMFARAVLADVVHVDNTGAQIPPELLFSALVSHMQGWARVLEGSFGLCFSEEMLLDLSSTRQSWSQSSSFSRDLLRSLALRYTVPSAAVAMAAAMAGLFPQDVKQVQPHPPRGRYCDMLTHVLTWKPYKIRFAVPGDIAALERLEEMAWKKHMRAPREGLLSRLRASPTTNLVVEIGGEVIAVLYMQRIRSPDDVYTQKFQQVFKAATPDGRVLQLLAINSHTDHRGIGSELRSFALHLARLDPTIDSVCAVTLCMDYASSGIASMQDYVNKHLEGSVNDRILTFHTGYGASVLGLVPGYRPEDTDNKATGVLIQYRPKDWSPGLLSPDEASNPVAIAEHTDETALTSAKSDPKENQPQPTLEILSEIMSDLQYEIDMDNLSQGFFSIGLDSFDMGVIQNRLGRALGRQLPATLMLDLPSVQDLTEQLDKERGVVKASSATIPDAEEADTSFISETVETARGRKRSPTQKVEEKPSDDPIKVWVKAWRQQLYKAERKMRARSSSLGRRSSRPLPRGPSNQKGTMAEEELEKIQLKLTWVLKLPQNQKRLERVVHKNHDSELSYFNDLRPVLDSIMGPMMLASGLVEDSRPSSMQEARDNMESSARRFGGTALARHGELIELMKLNIDKPFELLEPQEPDSPFAGFLKSYRGLKGVPSRSLSRPKTSLESRATTDTSRSSSRGRERPVFFAESHVDAKMQSSKSDLDFVQIVNSLDTSQLDKATDSNVDDEDKKALIEALVKLKGPMREKLARAALRMEQEEGESSQRHR
eukprot:TRINITY_DN15637_c0_g1_i1.p1 TRINITY_DN15637_c0_g1~~TRINITY_DN15637_c0_g1_i1.p1  ORF type:complete len:1163 (+),score=236.42 TRINITY_DN15637_c0_g1_i1:67-3555(+)